MYDQCRIKLDFFFNSIFMFVCIVIVVYCQFPCYDSYRFIAYFMKYIK